MKHDAGTQHSYDAQNAAQRDNELQMRFVDVNGDDSPDELVTTMPPVHETQFVFVPNPLPLKETAAVIKALEAEYPMVDALIADQLQQNGYPYLAKMVREYKGETATAADRDHADWIAWYRVAFAFDKGIITPLQMYTADVALLNRIMARKRGDDV